MKFRLVRAYFCLLILWAMPQHLWAADYHIQPALVAEHSVVTAGQTSTLALTMAPDAGWHGYWLNGGAAGFALQDVRWTAPAGVQIGEPQFPVPTAKSLFGMVNHVYENPYAILFPVQFTESLAPDTPITVTVSLRWLACDPKICVPESGTFTAFLEPGTYKSADLTARNPDFARYRQALPRPLDQGGAYQIVGTGKGARIRFAIPLPSAVALDAPHLFVAEQDVVDPNAAQIFARDGNRLLVETAAAAGSIPAQVTAVLRLNAAKDERAQGLSLRFAAGVVPDPARTGMRVAAVSDQPDWTMALLFGALGGAMLGGCCLI